MRRFFTHQQHNDSLDSTQKPRRLKSWLLLSSPKNIKSPRLHVGVFLLFILVTLGMVLAPFNASALTTASSKTNDPSWLAKSYWYYNALSQCMGSVGSWNVSGDGSDIKSGKWFYSGIVLGSNGDGPGGFIMRGVLDDIGDDGLMNCPANDNELLRGALSFWGISGTELACGTLFKRDNGTDCVAGNGGFGWKNAGGDNKAAFQKYIKQKVYDNQDPALGNVASFVYYRDTFLNGCAYKAKALTTKPSGSQVYTIANPKDDASTPPVYYIGDQKGSTDRWTTTNPNTSKTCSELAKLIAPGSTYATKYAEWLKKNKDDGTPIPEGNGCPDGTTSDSERGCSGTAEGQSSCVIEGVGWIVCPITNFLAGVSDAAYGLIKNFLQVNTKVYDMESGTYQAWSAFRNIANVAFVIAFIFIIFSQLTGQGVSNYGIKKMLPRLVIAAILVNISYFVCQIAVDVTQILGVGVRDILKNIPVGGGTTPGESAWTDVMGDILMGTAIGIAVAGTAAATIAVIGLSVTAPLLLAALLAILMTVIILVGRQAAIVILIVISPLAFVANILPNTESWFKKWYKMFFGLLMVFPIISLLYGGGELASKVISGASVGADAGSKFWFSIIALGVAAIPLIMTPSLLRGALNSTGTIGAKLSGFAAKANGGIRRSANTSRYGEAKQGIKNRFALRRAATRANSPIQQKFDNSRFGRALGLDKGAARAVNAVLHEDDQEVEAAVAKIKLQTNSVDRIPKAKEMLKEAIKTGNSTQARAAQKVLLGSGNPGIAAVQQVYSAKGADEDMKEVLGSSMASHTMSELRTDLNSAGLKGKNNALTTFAYSGAADSFNDALHNSQTYTKLNSVELAGQSLGNLQENRQHIDASMARAVLANNDASALLDAEKRRFFEAQAGGQATAASGTGTATTTAAAPVAQTVQQGATEQQNALSAAQRAKETAARASQGTAGDGIFVVEHGGDVTHQQPAQSAETQAPSNQPPSAPPTAPSGQ